jgi:predicted NBD/HSP70 family sugar kinase
MSEKINNPKSLRRNNKTNIAFKLLTKGEMSRLRLSEELGLTQASITQVVQELIEEDIVREVCAIQRNNTGRREILLRYNDEAYAAVGVNIESDNTHISVCTYRTVLEEKIIPTANLKLNGGDIALLAKEIAAMRERHCKETHILGTGVGIAGITDEQKGISRDSYGLLPLCFPLCEKLSEMLNEEVFVLNNIRAQARALITDRKDHFMFVKHAPGLGSALVTDGKLQEGADNRAGELGHTVAEPDGELCHCGRRGCLETIVSEKHITEVCARHLGRTLPAAEIYSMSRTDSYIGRFMETCIEKLAVAVVNAATLINPGRVLLTGGIFFNDFLRELFIKKAHEYAGCTVIPFELIENSRRIKAFSGSRHVLLKKLFEV